MGIDIGCERRALMVELHSNLTRDVAQMDELGFSLAANHVVHAIAMVEAELSPHRRGSDAHLSFVAQFAPA